MNVQSHHQLTSIDRHQLAGDGVRIFVDSIYYGDHGYDLHRADVEQWLTDHGTYAVSWFHFFRGPVRKARQYREDGAVVEHSIYFLNDDDDEMRVCWSFADPAIAMLFKLTFGGNHSAKNPDA